MRVNIIKMDSCRERDADRYFTFCIYQQLAACLTKPQKVSKASTFDNVDGKPKRENPLFYKDLADSIQVIS